MIAGVLSSTFLASTSHETIRFADFGLRMQKALQRAGHREGAKRLRESMVAREIISRDGESISVQSGGDITQPTSSLLVNVLAAKQ